MEKTFQSNYIKKKIGWNSEHSLKEGLTKTYNWIEKQINHGTNIDKFCRGNIEK